MPTNQIQQGCYFCLQQNELHYPYFDLTLIPVHINIVYKKYQITLEALKSL